MRSIRLIGKKVLVRRVPEVEETKSGLFLPSAARERPQLGHVIATGPDSFLKPGDKVMFPKFSDRYIPIDDEELLYLLEEELLASIE